ncbi:hypothetical protein DRO03_10405 [Methanosarcinales archaeon]|nr:MAG: hypothetical protein DRO03_10405 [Methanosarcinales archaeon]
MGGCRKITEKALRDWKKERKMKKKTACGGTIVVPRKAQEHLRAHPEVQKILAEAVGKVSLPRNGEFLAVEVEMGRVVGLSGCVKAPRVEIDDLAFFAQRIERKTPSRVVVSEGEPTTKVVVLAFASREDKRTYILVTSWVGSLAPKEPWDRNIRNNEEFRESLDFWSSHALVHDPAVMGEVFENSWGEILG